MSVNFERNFWYPPILPKNEQNNLIIVLLGKKKRIRSFVFWKNRRLEKNITTLSKNLINRKVYFFGQNRLKTLIELWVALIDSPPLDLCI